MAASSFSSIKPITKPDMENERSVVKIQPKVFEPVTAKSFAPHHYIIVQILLANALVLNVHMKNEDGGSPQAANTTGRDAFIVYSNENVMRSVMLFQAADAEEEEGLGVDREANEAIWMRSRLSFEIHSDQFYQGMML